MPRMPVALCIAEGTTLALPLESRAGAGNPISTGQAPAVWGVVIKKWVVQKEEEHTHRLFS